MNEISNESQQQLETEILIELSKLGASLYIQETCGREYHQVTQIQKKLNEYFDNTRLLQTTIKGNASL